MIARRFARRRARWGDRSRRFADALFVLLVVARIASAACVAQSAPEDATDPRTAGTKRMIERLEAIAHDANPDKIRFMNEERAVLFTRRANHAAGKPTEPALRLDAATEIVQAGRPEEALAELDRAEKAAAALGDVDPDFTKKVERMRALCWLRQGELDNCLAHHCCSSCIFPIEAGGVHAQRRGSEHAIEVLMRMLAKDPDDLEARWLLNLAHMTLGTWPDQVPERWRIDPKVFASEADVGRFRDVAPDVGLATSSISGGAALEDFDLDGFLDVMVSSYGFHDQVRFYRNNGDGGFTERTHEAGLDGLTGGLNLIHADYDNDGYPDVLVLRGAWLGEQGRIPNSLLRNRGDGTFDDVTESAGVLSFHPTQTAAWADLDGDGWLDLVIGNETERRNPPEPCELFLNQRDGTFKDVAKETGAALVGWVKGVTAGDFDDDGRVDLYYSVRQGLNRLLRNEPSSATGSPPFRFKDVSAAAGVEMPRLSFPTWFFDYDNDGRLDLFCASFTGTHNEEVPALYLGRKIRSELPCLYHNEGNGRFKEVGKEIGLARSLLTMGANYGDVDNDGWLDVYLGNGAPDLGALLPNRMFRNDRGVRFQDVTTSSGTGHLQKGHGVAFGDVDNDGDQDLFVEIGGGFSGDFYPNALFENPGNRNHWVTLQLRGVKANRFGSGARIRVDVATAAPAGDLRAAGDVRSIHLLCGTGGSFGSSSLQQEIGLGDATAIRAIEILWPGSNTRQRFEEVAMDRCWLAVEGESALRPVEQRKFKLGGEKSETGATSIH